MKNRLKAILLAAGLTAGMMSVGVYAEEATEAVTEASTEAVTEAAAEEAAEEAASEAAQDGTAASAEGGVSAQYYDALKQSIPATLTTLSQMTPEQLQAVVDNSQNDSEIALAMKWDGVREELGNFVEVSSQEVTEEGNQIIITNEAVYDGVSEDTKVTVEYAFNMKDGTTDVEWNIQYPMSKLMEQAGLNTIMGLGIVFLVLLFLSVLIGQLHWIPDLIEGKKKEKAAAVAAAPVSAPAPAPVEEENLTDDLELVAVITAAIAASEHTSADGFVVRTIKKANRRKWQNA